MNERVCIILNPAAKGERARRLTGRIQEALPRAEFKLTRKPKHAEALAREAAEEGFRVVVAAGGDGTINEVVNGIARTDAILGVLPVGTMNVFAMEMGLPQKLDQALDLIRHGTVRRIDLAKANGRYFVQLAGVGLDAQVVKKTDWGFKKAWGPLSYLVTAGQVIGQKPPKLVIKAEGMKEIEGTFVLVGNGRYYGGPFQFFPQANMRDGKLDVCVFKKGGYMNLLRYAHGVFTGSHTKLADVRYFKTSRMTVTCDETVPMEVDGELHCETPVKFKISRHSLRVLAPRQK
jgi:YegS/Rv2252/BmrU family lipid kinase